MKSKQNFSRVKRKKHDSSTFTRKIDYSKKEKAKYPFLAEKVIAMSDIVLEILDARFINEMRNREIEEQIKKLGKKIIFVFNKSDLINIGKIKEQDISYLNPKVFVSCITKKGGKELRNKIKIISSQIENPVDKVLGKITVGIIGYPNTGKSSVINLLVGKPASGIGADAGFTKGIQKVNLTSDIVLLDSPGVIPRKEYSDSEIWLLSRHAKIGARSSSQVKNPAIAVAEIMKEFPVIFDNFYNVSSEGDSEILIEKIGRQKGFLKKGNEVDEDKTARLILEDWQQGRIRK